MRRRSALSRPLRYQHYNVVLWIVGANVIVFALTSFAGGLVTLLAMNPRETMQAGMFWQPFTYMFVHSPTNYAHILFNMFGLFLFGTQVENRIGSTEFLLFYLLCGLFAGIVSLGVYLVSGALYIQLLGASGAVFATLLAYATLFPDSTIYLFAILPIKAPALVLGFTALELFRGISNPASGVAHLTHLAGFLGAFVYLVVRLGLNPIRVFTGRQ